MKRELCFFFSFPLPHSTYRRRSISYFNSNKKCMGMLPSVKQGHHVHHVCSLLWLFVLSRVYLGGRHSDQITHILLYSQNCRFSLFLLEFTALDQQLQPLVKMSKHSEFENQYFEKIQAPKKIRKNILSEFLS